MTTDPTFERTAIRLRAQAFLLGGRVYDSIPDDFALERSENGVKPYAVIHYGTVFRLGTSRSLVGEEEQPQVLPVTITCYARSQEAARASAGAVRDLFVGWSPSPGSSEMEAPSGTAYRDRDSAGTPTLFAEAVSLETVFNLGSNDGYVPGPGSIDGGGVPIDTIQSIVQDFLASAHVAYERHDFPIPTGQWSITHSLGRVPTVTTYDMSGNRILSDYEASDTLVIVTWAVPQAGFVILT